MDDTPVQCATCSQGLLDGNVGYMWLYACGHVACGTCAGPSCCGDKAPLLDLMQDDMVKSTRWYAQTIYPSINVYTPIAQLIASLQFLLRCIIITYRQNHECSLPAMVPPPETVFASLDTLSMSPSMIGMPWKCPRDGRDIKAGETRCECGYVNLKAVMLDPMQASIWMGNGQKSKERKDPSIWTCARCTYEYNQVALSACGRCNTPRSQTYRCPSCNKEAGAPGPCEACSQIQGWTCSNCRRSNPASTGQCPCTLWACTVCHYASNPNEWNICQKCQCWQCRKCTFANYPTCEECQACSNSKYS